MTFVGKLAFIQDHEWDYGNIGLYSLTLKH